MSIVIEGRRPLSGEVTIGGAKNAALPIIAASLLTADEVCLRMCPTSRIYAPWCRSSTGWA